MKNWLLIFFLLLADISFAAERPEIQLPNKLNADNVLLLYKEFNTVSKQIADYYAQRRHIPRSHIIPVQIFRNSTQLSQHEFENIYARLKPYLTDNIKVIVLAWHAPYRVECMSITSAFTLGFDTKYCSRPGKQDSGCHKTALNPFYNASSSMLWQQNSALRLSMMLSGKTVRQAKALIDRGVATDNSQPTGNAYLVRTHDAARSTRWPIFKQFADIWGNRSGINVQYIDDRKSKKATQIQHKDNILFYQTGLTHVPAIETNHYLPGAIADHLTSAGGMGIEQSGQMKAFRWLEAGVTGSYGTVVEPCNYIEKFPNPQVLIPSYRNGDTLIEAYWKSVQQPGEGLFIGEPLARPWDKTHWEFIDNTLIIRSKELNPDKTYHIEQQQTKTALWKKVNALFDWKKHSVNIIIHQAASSARYRIIENK